jgi:transposase
MSTIKSRDRALLASRRKAAGRLFDKGTSQAAVARKYKVSTAAACQWYAMWKKGKKALNSKGPPGSVPKLKKKEKERLKTLLVRGPTKAGFSTEFWTLSRIKSVAKKELHVELGTTSVWRVVTGLGFSCQKPERRAKERNEKSIAEWKLGTFPSRKKMGEETRLSAWISG